MSYVPTRPKATYRLTHDALGTSTAEPPLKKLKLVHGDEKVSLSVVFRGANVRHECRSPVRTQKPGAASEHQERDGRSQCHGRRFRTGVGTNSGVVHKTRVEKGGTG